MAPREKIVESNGNGPDGPPEVPQLEEISEEKITAKPEGALPAKIEADNVMALLQGNQQNYLQMKAQKEALEQQLLDLGNNIMRVEGAILILQSLLQPAQKAEKAENPQS